MIRRRRQRRKLWYMMSVLPLCKTCSKPMKVYSSKGVQYRKCPDCGETGKNSR